MSKQKQNRVNRICKQACKVIGLTVSSPGDMYVKMSLSKVNNIIKNKDHLIHHCYKVKGYDVFLVEFSALERVLFPIQWFYSVLCDLYVHVP